jgi:flavin-dependent dehydrogenase
MSTYDLIVIGAGPAGCATAISAARAGARVLLLERGRFPRDKVCGEFVSAESLNLLSNLLSTEYRDLILLAPRIAQGRIFVDGTEIPVAIRPAAASIARFQLDSALWRSSLAYGIDARQESPALGVDGEGPFNVRTPTASFDTKVVVNATGRWSNLNMRNGEKSPTRERWIGLKAHFCEPQAASSVDLYFFDGGYCGVQPINGSGSGAVNACAMVRAQLATTLPEVFRLHPALLERSRGWQPLTEQVSTSPLIFRDAEPVKGTMLQVGDSAAFVDPFVGDGISLALRSGVLAAECQTPFFRGECSLHEAATQYHHRYTSTLSHVFRTSSMLRRALSWPRRVRKPLLALFEKAPTLARGLVTLTR